MNPLNQLLSQIDIQPLIDISQEAGRAILGVYEESEGIKIERKADDSPLTQADKASNDVINKGLQKYFSHIPIISEENRQVAYKERKDWQTCWMVDPLDGTKEFIKRNGEFTVNIALIHDNAVVLGVIYVPVTDVTYYAKKGEGAFKIENGNVQKIGIQEIVADETVRIVVSRSHLKPKTEAYIAQKNEQFAAVDTVPAGSSLKLCLVAEGTAHIYPRFGPSMEWDIAAGHIIATEAGARLERIPEGGELAYNKSNLLNPSFIVSVE